METRCTVVIQCACLLVLVDAFAEAIVAGNLTWPAAALGGALVGQFARN